MTSRHPNVEMLEVVVAALGELTEEMVFVGGCATGLLITDMARPPVRATQDVDVIAAVASKADYYELEKNLKRAGFSQDTSGEVVCRWTIRNIKIDVMPTDEKILGFSNFWYPSAIATATNYQLPSGHVVRLIASPQFIATKIEAFHGRGKNDFRASHDIEDIITVVDGRRELIDEVNSSDESLRDYLAEELEEFLGTPTFTDALPGHMAPDQSNQDRVPIIIERLRVLARL